MNIAKVIVTLAIGVPCTFDLGSMSEKTFCRHRNNHQTSAAEHKSYLFFLILLLPGFRTVGAYDSVSMLSMLYRK